MGVEDPVTGKDRLERIQYQSLSVVFLDLLTVCNTRDKNRRHIDKSISIEGEQVQEAQFHSNNREGNEEGYEVRTDHSITHLYQLQDKLCYNLWQDGGVINVARILMQSLLGSEAESQCFSFFDAWATFFNALSEKNNSLALRPSSMQTGQAC